MEEIQPLPGARERRLHKEAVARRDLLLDMLAKFAAEGGKAANALDDDELLTTMVELAEWVERQRDE